MGFTDCFALISIINENPEICLLLTTIAYSIRGFQTRSRQLKVGKMIDENLEIRPLLIPTSYPIRVGSGEWEVGSLRSRALRHNKQMKTSAGRNT